jgi:very-short-patch-repair endonuclease
MDILTALQKHNGVARMRDLKRFGIDRGTIWAQIRAHRILRLRKGWVSLPTISPSEIRAVEAHGLLTCAAAARVLGYPVEKIHFHIRSRRDEVNEFRTTRRKTPSRIGACVGLVEMVIDYSTCQKAEWTLALVDHLERVRALTPLDWEIVERATPKAAARIVQMRSSTPESILESVVRFRLAQARINYTMQVPIGRFHADFVLGRGLVVETHGAEFHSERADWERDRRKVAWLRADGWDVLEISYSQVFDEWDSVLRTIRTALSRQRNRRI